MQQFSIGLIINPLAGIGGSVGLKGSDGSETVTKALAMGATPRATDRTRQALMKLVPYKHLIVFHTWPGPMGADLLREMGFLFQVHGFLGDDLTTADDTVHAAKMFAESGVDLILFAGGDGTARNICDSIPESQPVLGIPAGVKIHSGVYAVTPSAAGEILSMLVTGELVDIRPKEVRDIDESAFREGRVRARHYGELLVPESGRFLQNVKQGGREVEELVLNDIADDLKEQLDDDVLLVAGPGSTTRGIMECLGHDSTLLGVDLFAEDKLLGGDVRERDILEAFAGHTGPVRVMITAIGGQGHILGRGNQQLSPKVISEVLEREGRDGLIVVATKSKLKELEGRPLLVDSGDPELDKVLSGTLKVMTGYRDAVLYPVASV
ncbi:ATP-NAD kinase family protein [Sansalvadorimonas sp. 2012CJ34-2]|uniref:ATP-NAD kinase family protein n=1 Tax=Parendozoicomonas callyspongiae TaxID=2942213 RepID=A0ABT0PI69_9GAMM|nr:ATP-NAD kinase family protein [Sansalvadorimonas sp. 2012CJ34-2]MCL6271030.1 ATP-NAD kinase family protein [Sansalvadorimonas sp. 2012CJ34-2]